MRIISGTFKGRRFSPPKSFHARPTTDFAKENLFNILNNRVDWEEAIALDLFSGTGNICLEFISRGCPQVTAVEKSPVHAKFIKKVADELKVNNLLLFTMDTFRFLESNREKFDLIFVDPPYDLPSLETIPELIIEKELLKEGGIFVMEHSKKNDFSQLPYFQEKRVYGSVNFSIFEKE
jgi:16S rRNA (guanine(966)-N(2))-methyltransferase RsmD